MKKGLLTILAITALLLSAASYALSHHINPITKSKIANSSSKISNSDSINSDSEKSSDNINVATNPDLTKVSDVHTKAIDFKLKNLKGEEVSLSSFKGKKVLLNFWTTTYAPCKVEMSYIQKIYNERKDSDLVILSINSGENVTEVEKFIEQNKYTFNVLVDSNKDAISKYNITSIPSYYLIDSNGIIVDKHVGSMTLSEINEYLNEL